MTTAKTSPDNPDESESEAIMPSSENEQSAAAADVTETAVIGDVAEVAEAETLVIAPTSPSASDPAWDITPPPAALPQETIAAEPAPLEPVGSPRTRWAGIIWGLLLAALAAWGLVATLVEPVRDATAAWWLSLNGVTGVAYSFLALGAIGVICAAIGLISRAQRARRTRLASS